MQPTTKGGEGEGEGEGEEEEEEEEEEERARCPRCGGAGSPHLKTVLNHDKQPYRYWYFAHSSGREGSTGKVSWCYLGKSPHPPIDPTNHTETGEKREV